VRCGLTLVRKLAVGAVTVSMRVMSAGAGYRYLLDSVAVADGQRAAGRPLVDYYTEPGCPPGRWLGSGGATLAAPLQPGGVVGEEQLALLLGEGRDPTTGDALGQAYPHYPSAAERIAARTATLPPDLSASDRAAAVERITVEEQARRSRRAVAGYDLTFSAPKSVSVLWALATPEVRAEVVAAHHAAIDDVLALFEAEVAATRMGASGPDGAVAQVDVHGVMAAAFDHYDSRAGDPQLHTHVVIANKVRTVLDGRWRSLDGRPLHAAMVALSEHYTGTLADHLTTRLGVVWQHRDRGPGRNAGWEIAGVPDGLLDAFSSRSSAIEAATDRLVAGYIATHGRRPTARTVLRLRQQATLQTRPDKQLHSLATLTARWHAHATTAGHAADGWLRAALAGRVQQRLHATDISAQTVHGLASRVVEVVGEKRSTWRRWNLHAEASRQLHGIRFATHTDRLDILDRVVTTAEAMSVRLSPPDLAVVPEVLRRSDGTSVLRQRHSTLFTSAALLEAEDRLLELGRTRTGPRLPGTTVEGAADGLGADQLATVHTVAGSGRVVDVLVGPAGAGKTTTLRALHTAWTGMYGPGSVVGLAPSAAAAEVLSDQLSVPADTLAKWLHDHKTSATRLRAGQLVIVDEASLAGTVALQRLADQAAQVGAKVLLVGDPAQLAAIDAGGALQLLASDRTDTAELTDVRRFHHAWEAAATVQLRRGDPAVLDTYAAHGRLHDGDSEHMLDAAYTAWRHDLAAGRSSLLIAPTRELVHTLNQRAQADQAAAGHTSLDVTAALADGTCAGVGDVVVTRRNDRRLATASGRWVRNGDRWTVTAIHPDHSLSLRGRTGTVRVAAGYAAAHVELGYAVTAHRGQGATVDTAHTIVTPQMTRETLYVAMTRGRHTNTAYTATDTPDTEPHQHTDPPTGRQILSAALRRVGAEPSAHAALRVEQERVGSIGQLAAEYDTIATLAQQPRWTALIRSSGLTDHQADQVIASEAFGPLCAALRRADAYHLVPEQLLPRLIAARPIDGVDDIAAVLHHRLTAVTTRAARDPRRPAPRLIVGIIYQATGPIAPELGEALHERQSLIEQQARHLARNALHDRADWIVALGPAPSDLASRAAWLGHLTTIAAYRDLAAAELGDRHIATSDPRIAAEQAYRHARQLATRPVPTLPASRTCSAFHGPSL
jgi:conjugative relaxase-like TrwC/TraI family protein